MAVTIKDIARKAGVSHTTVSRALRDHDALSKRTIKKVKQIAKEMGYVPSAVARGLRTNQTQAIGVVVPHIDDPFCSAFVQGVHDILHGFGFALMLTTLKQNKNTLDDVIEDVIKRLTGRHVDGILFCTQDDAVSLDTVALTSIPHLIVRRRSEEPTLAPYVLGQHKAQQLLQMLGAAPP